MHTIYKAVKGFVLDNLASDEESIRLAPSTNLSEGGFLDSLSTLKLISFLEKEFEIDLEAEDLEERNFESLESIERLVIAKKGAMIKSLKA